ncbi:MAG: hypothetical protein M3463_02420 [Verrucomicrobiota bacterium]|nr:hypothetical protein [Verrucomicrobiota bacterium]
MKTIAKLTLAAAAATFFGTGSAFAEHTLTRISHPNGPATFAFKPPQKSTMIGVYGHGRTIGRVERPVASSDRDMRLNRRDNGRGVYYVPGEPR